MGLKKFGLPSTARFSAEGDGGKRRVVFLANSGQPMSGGNDLSVDLDSLLAPLEGGGRKLVRELTESDVLSLPFMIDHGYKLEHVAGHIIGLEITGQGLVATGELADTPAGQLVHQFLSDGVLHNNFSISLSFDPDMFDYAEKRIRGGVLTEISAVYTGADERTKVLEFCKTHNLDLESFMNITTVKPDVVKSDTGVVQGGLVPQTGQAFTRPRENWLDTMESVFEFMDTRRGMNVNKRSRKTFAKQWHDVLKNRNVLQAASSITDPDDLSPLIPQPIVTAIIDQFNQADPVWNLVRKTGLPRTTVMEQNVGLFDDNGRAHGHVRGETKVDEQLGFRTRVINPQFIYKKLTIDQEDLREASLNPNDGGLFFRYLMEELMNRIFMTIGYSIIFDDFTDMYNTTKNSGFLSIEAMANDSSSEWPGSEFALTLDEDDAAFTTRGVADNAWTRLRLAASRVKAPGEKVLVTSSETVALLSMLSNDNGTPIFGTAPSVEQLTAALGVSQIVTPVWWGDEQDETMLGCVFVPSQYGVVGSTAVEEFTDFNLSLNQHEFLNEVYVGGGLLYPKSACVVKPVSSES